jgi:hypothetical protein
MHQNYRRTNGINAPAIRMSLVVSNGSRGASPVRKSRMVFNSGFINGEPCQGNQLKCSKPMLKIKYYKPCYDNVAPTYSTLPTPGWYCYSEPIDTFVCRPNIVPTAINPYRWGIFGNWRMDRAYTYYDRRVESDPLQATNIRTDGEIKSFTPFWSFVGNAIVNNGDTTKWVWNSEITALNSKGLEIENHDPLNRYNAGQYGYNRTLPVAVTQNSKYRNQFFEGFEDYDYTTDTCKKCGVPRYIDLLNSGTRVDTVSHTGMHSIRVGGNQYDEAFVPIVPVAQDTISPKINFRIDSTALVTTHVNGTGHGLNMEYKLNLDPCNGLIKNHWYPLSTFGNIAVDWGEGRPPGICKGDWFNVRWYGKIQPRYSQTYTFYGIVDDGMVVKINGRQISAGREIEWPRYKEIPYPTDTITLQAGQLYDISVDVKEDRGHVRAFFYWESASQPREIVPASQLYRTGMLPGDSAGSFRRDTTWCIKYRTPKPVAVVHPGFSPVQGSKLFVSAWVKEDAPCINGSYTNSRIDVVYNNGSSAPFLPAGPIIDGWQRIEGVLNIPTFVVNMRIRLRSLSSTPVFFDDVRIHPFNANMKSFVYNPVNLRLMAELDENNYATFYEYDDDGTLIRLKKETERGIKTIKETRSALSKQ